MPYPEMHHIGFKLVATYFMFQMAQISAAKLAVSKEKMRALQSIESHLATMNVEAAMKYMKEQSKLA